MLSRLSAGRSSSATKSPDKVLRTFAEQKGMLAAQFDREWPLVANLFNKHCCPHLEVPPELPLGGKIASLFIVNYSNLPSLAVLVIPGGEVKASFAVVYGKGVDVGDPLFGHLLNAHDSEVKPENLLTLNQDIGIFKVPENPDETSQAEVYLTAKGLEHEAEFDKLKELEKIDDTQFQSQVRLIGNLVTSLNGKFHYYKGILEMLPLPQDSLVVADVFSLRRMGENGPRSLAIYFSNGVSYPAMVSWVEHDAGTRWKVYIRYLSFGNVMLEGLKSLEMFTANLEHVLAPPPPESQLKDTFLAGMEGEGEKDPFKVAVEAAEQTNMPKLEIPDGYFDTKEKTLPFSEMLNLFVRYHHAQRKYAYSQKRVFEHALAMRELGSGPVDFNRFMPLMELNHIPTPAAMTFLLSERRFAMGWAMDGVEIGTGHNCLIKDEQEKVYIAGEIVLLTNESALFNFNSGTFTRQISPLYFAGEDAHEAQWKGLIKELIISAWNSKFAKLLGEKLIRPKVIYTDKVLLPFTPPVDWTRQVWCQGEQWMRNCACFAQDDSYLNYCDTLSPCDLDGCQPP